MRIYFAQVPWDMPNDYPIYRYAELEVDTNNITEEIWIFQDDLILVQ